MPKAENVNPGKWSSITVLFDNSEYSVISGQYEGVWTIGERWNGENEELGFPSNHGYPQWHVVPPFLQIFVLMGALTEIKRSNYEGSLKHAQEIARVLPTIMHR